MESVPRQSKALKKKSVLQTKWLVKINENWMVRYFKNYTMIVWNTVNSIYY